MSTPSHSHDSDPPSEEGSLDIEVETLELNDFIEYSRHVGREERNSLRTVGNVLDSRWMLAVAVLSVIGSILFSAYKRKLVASMETPSAPLVGVQLLDVPVGSAVWLDGERLTDATFGVSAGSRHRIEVEAGAAGHWAQVFRADGPMQLVVELSPDAEEPESVATLVSAAHDTKPSQEAATRRSTPSADTKPSQAAQPPPSTPVRRSAPTPEPKRVTPAKTKPETDPETEPETDYVFEEEETVSDTETTRGKAADSESAPPAKKAGDAGLIREPGF